MMPGTSTQEKMTKRFIVLLGRDDSDLYGLVSVCPRNSQQEFPS